MTYNGNSFHLRLFYTTPPEQRKTFVWRLFPIVHYMVGWPEEIWKASRANYNWEEEGNWGEQRWPLIQVTIVFHLFMHNNSRASAISVSGVFAIYHFSLLEATYRLKQQDKLIEWDAFTPMTKLIKGVQITAKAYESFYKSSLLRIFLCYPKINNQTIDLVQNFFWRSKERFTVTEMRVFERWRILTPMHIQNSRQVNLGSTCWFSLLEKGRPNGISIERKMKVKTYR